MSQKFFNVWKDPVKSFELSEQQNGMLPRGRYNGYDSISDTGAAGPGVTIEIDHNTTGASKTIEAGTGENNVGIAKLPNGTIVHENDVLDPLVVGSNAANPFDRIDILIADHTYTALPGGTAVTYAIIQGAAGGPVEPSLPSPTSQVILGRLYIDASTDAIGNINYVPADVPMVGNETYSSFIAKLDLQTVTQAAADHATLQANIDAINYVPVGLISMWSGSVVSIPTGWGLCDGTLGTPNLSGKFIVGYDAGDPDYNTIGNIGGEKEHTLTVAEMPVHNHTTSRSASTSGNGDYPEINAMGNDSVTTTPAGSTNTEGNGDPHENRPPYFTLAYIIKL